MPQDAAPHAASAAGVAGKMWRNTSAESATTSTVGEAIANVGAAIPTVIGAISAVAHTTPS